MFERWRRRRQNREVVERTYGAVVARARRPALYLEGAVPDTVLGRYEALGIEVLLLMERCRADPALRAFSQDVVDRFMLDMDHSLREIGIGYQGVPRRMRRLAERFYTRVADYDGPLTARDEVALAAALRKRVFAGEAPEGAADFLARQMIATARGYEALSADDILSGRIAPHAQGEDADVR
ncbi:ubiquinol-cytochrome C chaperone family protein [Aureimonas mangrovi]|uniref:ubiquinol-cytochrome C chaperone family protein n=1 Tax=Aureimonas mangrovi TaxID=2758041 RepID=UPI00163D7F10|nr:ubiquinol-cytochrome C chaperone family protein [Aureimonas mangrovi]